MPKYKYSVIRFVPSPVRGEFVNLGVIVGSDATDEWAIDIVGRKNRAANLADSDILPTVTAELERLRLRFPNGDDEHASDISEEWLHVMAVESRNVIQYSTPQSVVAEDAAMALEKLWNLFIFEQERQKRESLTKHMIRTQYLRSLQQNQLTQDHYKTKAKLNTSHSSTSIDVAVHNGVAKRLTQCWSFQVKNTESVLNEVKAWAWTMRDLRRNGGAIRAGLREIGVPKDVELSVVYASPVDTVEDEFTSEAKDVFSDSDVDAEAVPMEKLQADANHAASLLAD